MWYSVNTAVVGVGEYGLQKVKPEEWNWERKGWRVGRPGELPEYTKWGKEEWVGWLES